MIRPCTIACVLSSLLVASSCGRTPPQGGTTASPPPRDAIGPVPGGLPQPAGPANPYAADRTAQAEGRRLFVRFNCSGCHGGHAGGGMGPSLRDVDWIYGSRDVDVFGSISEGRANGMPSWHTRLTADQMWKLVAYIRALRTRNEPQPPPGG
jgi:cytochrome c oxidase cbb3-type subunit III